ncbi:hypothetical protein GWK74_02755 [Candidatus Saccharibacteria bacterium oral taxon 488]|nr:hypothetical protein GWK74_02755 [Candidatus Saccharibacteria bacterium oral taxon 488]
MDIVLRLLIARSTRGGRTRITAGDKLAEEAALIQVVTRTSTSATMAEVVEAATTVEATVPVLLS